MDKEFIITLSNIVIALSGIFGVGTAFFYYMESLRRLPTVNTYLIIILYILVVIIFLIVVGRRIKWNQYPF